MDNESTYYIVAAYCLVSGLASAMVASQKGRDGFGWFVVGALFAPVALPVALIASPLRENMNGFKKCTYCLEPINSKAMKCPHCGSTAEETAASNTVGGSDEDSLEKKQLISKAESLGYEVESFKGSNRITLKKNGKNHDFFILERAKEFLSKK